MPRASANVGYGSSSGYGIDSNVNVNANASVDLLFDLLGVNADTQASVLDVGPTPISGGTAPAPYSQSTNDQNLASVGASVGVNVPLVANVGVQTANFTGLLDSSASSNVDGASGTRTTSGSARVDNLNLNFGNISASLVSVPITNLPLLHIGASVLTSNASVTGNGDGVSLFTPTVTNQITGLSIQILGLDVTNNLLDATARANLAIGAPVDVTVNLNTLSASLFNSLAVVVDNSVVLSGSLRISNYGQTTSSNVSGTADAFALHVGLTNVSIDADLALGNALLNTEVGVDINGTVTVAGASAAEAIPEPNAIMLALLGGGSFIFWRRRF